METHDPRVAELFESVIRAGTDAGYWIIRDSDGRLQIAANGEPVNTR